MRSHAVLSILIPVPSRTDLLAECLASLHRHLSDDLPSETIVVFNEIDPACAAVLESRFPAVRFLRSPVNLGLAGSANRARRAASGRFLVTLHDDATIEPGWAEALLEATHKAPGSTRSCCVNGRRFPALSGVCLGPGLSTRRSVS